jgi:hypothetical protein
MNKRLVADWPHNNSALRRHAILPDIYAPIAFVSEHAID